MKAEQRPRINLADRTPLETVIPLSTPFVVFVDPSSACNFRCTFCPTGDHELIRDTGRYQGLMDFDIFRKIIDDLGQFPSPLKVLRLYKDGEPLLNPRFADMVRLAKDSGYVSYVDTTSNGVYLTQERSLELVAAGLDRINISIDGLSDQDFLRHARAKVDFKGLVENIRFFYENKGECEVLVKAPSDFMSDADKAYFFETFGDICDYISLENFAPCWPEFDVPARTGVAITEGIYGNTISDTKVCPYIFYSVSINSDGLVSLCFLDWARKLVIGDIRTQSLKDIWDGETLRAHRLTHLRGEREQMPVCSDCGQLTHCLPDNIDAHAAMVLDRMTKGHPCP